MKDLNELFKGTWLEDLLTTDPAIVTGDPEPGEEVIGEMNELESRLWGLSDKLSMASHMLEAQMRFGGVANNEEKERKFNMMSELQQQASAAREVMWCCIRERLCSLEPRSMGIRTGNVVVLFHQKKLAPSDMLKSILGGIKITGGED